jgi:hypothetical protein
MFDRTEKIILPEGYHLDIQNYLGKNEINNFVYRKSRKNVIIITKI